MNELQKIEKQVQLEESLRKYQGDDRIVLAEEKKKEIEDEKIHRKPFIAKTDIPLLDDCVDGFRKGQLAVVSGPPKHGKTSFCQTLTKRFIAQEHKVLWFSYEVGYEELFEKFPMDNLDFYIPNYLESGNLDWVERRIIEAKVKHKTDIVFIDHLDFLRDPNVLKGVGMNLAAYVGGIMQKIKRMAVEQNILIFLLSHIRKNNWTTKDLPDAEELRDSGQIAQLADFVIMIMRERAEKGSEEVYNGTNAFVGVMANRHNGKTKRIPVAFEESADGKREFTERLIDAHAESAYGSQSVQDWGSDI